MYCCAVSFIAFVSRFFRRRPVRYVSRQRNYWPASAPPETESTVPPSYRAAAAFATSIPDAAPKESAARKSPASSAPARRPEAETHRWSQNQDLHGRLGDQVVDRVR